MSSEVYKRLGFLIPIARRSQVNHKRTHEGGRATDFGIGLLDLSNMEFAVEAARGRYRKGSSVGVVLFL